MCWAPLLPAKPKQGGLAQLPTAEEGWHSRCSVVQAGTSPGCGAAPPASRHRDSGTHLREGTCPRYGATAARPPRELRPHSLSLPRVHKSLPSPSRLLRGPGFAGETFTRLVWHKAPWFWLGAVRGEQEAAFSPALWQQLPRKWEVGLDLALPGRPSAAGTGQLLLSGAGERMGPAVQSGRRVFTSCQSLLH